MTATAAGLDLHVTRQVHPGLTLEVSLRLGRECGVVFGPSGAGKSTLLRLIAGLQTPDRGHVRLDGEPLFDSGAGVNRPLRLRRLGMVFQDDLLFPHLSVASNVGFGLKGRPRSEVRARTAEVAALCGVAHLLARRPETLSGGERQRVGLARALAPKPRLLLCDEPVSALDLSNRNALIDRLRDVQAAEGIPILYVTHSPSEAVSLGTTLFLLEGGRVVAQGPPLDVLAARGSTPIEGVRNTFTAEVEGHTAEDAETRVRIVGGPVLVVPHLDRPAGTRVVVEVLAEEIMLARDPVGGLSARNVIAGVVDRVVGHGTDAEVVVRTGGVAWVVSVVGSAARVLGLEPGADVRMVVKARSCHPRFVDDASERDRERG